MKIFLDTNVVIDYILEREPYYGWAAEIVSRADDGLVDILASSLTMINARYICVERMKQDPAAYKVKFDMLRPILKISSVESSDIYSSYDTDWEDFEDGVQYFSAKRAGCNYIVTRNEGDFEKSDIPVLTPIQMTTLLYEQRQHNNSDNSDHS